MNPTILTKLRNVLARLFPDETSIRRIVDDAGLERQKIDFGSSAINVWHSVLMEAEKVDRVDALLQVVEGEYGNNREFQAACQAYRQSQGKQETVNPHVNVSTRQPTTYYQPWYQRLPSVLMGILLIGFAGGGAYWMWKGLPSGGIITPTATAAISASGLSKEKSTEGSSIPTELPTATLAAVVPSPTSIVTLATATSAPTPTATIPQPTNTPPEVASALCSFAFLVLDEQSEEPIRRATIAVLVGVRQDTGTTDSTGYYLAHLPCNNEQAVEARVRVSADDYSPYNRSVFLSDETTEILLESKATPTPNVTSTATFTPIPTPQPTTTTTMVLTPEPTATVTPTPPATYPCEAQIYSKNGATKVNIAIRTNPAHQESAKAKEFLPGVTVYVHNKYEGADIWYEIYNVNGRLLGWISSEYLSSSCLN